MNNNNLLGSDQNLDNSTPTIIREFILRREVKGTTRSMARELPLKPHTGPNIYLNLYEKFQAYDLENGVDIVLGQQFSDSQQSFSPGEVGLKIILPKTTIRRTADPDLLGNSGKLAEMAYDKKEDSDGTSQFSSFTNGFGGAGTTLSPGQIMAAATSLEFGNSLSDPEPVEKPFYGQFHPCSLVGLAGRLVPYSASSAGGTAYDGASNGGTTLAPGQNDMSQAIIKQGPKVVKQIADVNIYSNLNISVDTNSDAVGAIWTRNGLIFVNEMEPAENQTTDYSARSVEIVFVGSYGWGVHRPSVWGVKMTNDAAIPTA